MQNEYQNDSAATAAARLSKRRFSVEREIDESVTNTGEHKSTSSCKHGEKDFYLNGRCNNCPDGSKKEVPLICTKNCRVNDYNSESNPVSDDYNSSLCSSYSSEINDKYKYYSPYLGKRNEYERSLSPCKYYESVSPRSSDVSPGKDVYGRPPSGCFFPTTIAPYNSLRRRSFQRGSSRFLRLDFHEPHTDENVLVREKRLRERETQSVLREIREKSRERNHDRRSLSVEKSSDLDKCYNRHLDPKTNIDLNTSSMNSSADTTRHVRNKSIEVFSDYGDRNDGKERKRRSSSRSKDMMIEENVNCTNKIIEELQNISSNIKKAQSDIINCDDGISEKYKVKIIMKSGKSKEKPINITDSRITDIQRIPEIVSNIKMPKSEKEKKIKKSSKYPESSTLTEKGLEISDLKNEAVVEIEKTKIESKLLKPKFYSIKKDDNKSLESSKSGGNIENSHEKRNIKDEPENLHIETSRIARPKSYPNSKITSTKDLKKSSRSGSTVSAVMEKLMEKVEKSSGTKNMVNILNTSGQQATIQAVTPSLDNPESKPMETIRVSGLPSPVDGNKTLVKKVFGNKGTKLVGNKLKSPDKELNDKTAVEKKSGQGFLHAIGQKFEKLRENARNRDKINTMISDEMGANKEKQDTMEKIVKKKKSKSIIPDRITTNNNLEENENKIDKKSQITAIIHSLRECSVPRQTAVTESVLLKHAVSVEDMSTTFNKRNVNKVLGLFKKFEKNDHNRKVLNTKSTSDIEKHISHNINQKDKIKSNKFINRMRKTKTISPTKVLKTDSFDNNEKNNIIQKSVIPKDAVTTNTNYPKAIQNNCLECSQEKVDNLTKRSQLKEINSFVNQEKESSKAKRKGLVLDLSNHKKIESNENGNILDNYLHTNNNLTRNDTEEINHNYLLTPPNENPTNYSTDSRSPDNECPSSSTFLSPSEEVDLCFDNWSVRSDDNLIKKTIPPPSLYPSSSSTISRFSRVSQFSSPTNNENLGDSVNDRIKRRSFYICFNEKRPKPHSNILGSEIRDYYRETAADYHRSRPSDRVVSPNNDNNTHHNTYEYIKPRKLSSAGGNDLRSSCNNRLKSTTTDYIKPRTNIHDTIGNRHVDNNDYIQLRSSHIEPTTTTHYYNTLDPKRRSSFGSNGKSQIGLTDIDGYATLGRLIRPYKNSSILDQTTNNITASSIGGSLRRDKRTPIELRNLPKSSTSIPTPSVARSPTNI